ncbi:galactose mutarotase [Listeria monocytogenes]|nr:galactose mutarotase [Listeria monocytogenes]EJG4560991.1 galactose mutarotase [Listeria monocytogenes]EJG4573102.1 galactose mutarotase [Listeria monocytogenes]EJI3955094.1 galactose mutarotase [Listeria monocytogenes]EJM7649929.1 galactose mutarotase [Listeria monocytogenes]
MVFIEVIKKKFGEFEGETVWQWTMVNDHGMRMSVLNYGAIVTSLETKDKFGDLANISLGFTSLDDYLAHSPYFGATLGPVAGRISNGRFKLDGKEFQLTQNEGNNHRHGGKLNFSKKIWNVTVEKELDQMVMTFDYCWADGENGYPGNINARMTYTLNNKNEWLIDYEAKCDQPTIYNPSNHIYFNLSGETGATVLQHQLWINSDRFLPIDEESLPIGEKRSVENTIFDLRAGREVAEITQSQDQQIKLVGAGLDHAFILKHENGRPDAVLFDPKSGRRLEMETEADSVLVYTANSLTSTFEIDGWPVPKYAGITMETQGLVDAINQDGFGDIILRPEKPFTSRTAFRFTAES